MDFSGIFKQAQTLKEEFEKKQKEFEKREFVGVSGGNLVKITLNGQGKASSVKFDETILKEDKDINMLQDLIVAAFNNAKSQYDEEHKKLMSEATGGSNLGDFNIPDGFDKFFK
jgi:DNA-binding YbaB/EbfC family protein